MFFFLSGKTFYCYSIHKFLSSCVCPILQQNPYGFYGRFCYFSGQIYNKLVYSSLYLQELTLWSAITTPFYIVSCAQLQFNASLLFIMYHFNTIYNWHQFFFLVSSVGLAGHVLIKKHIFNSLHRFVTGEMTYKKNNEKPKISV